MHLLEVFGRRLAGPTSAAPMPSDRFPVNAAGREGHVRIGFRRHPRIEQGIEGRIDVGERIERVLWPVLLVIVGLELGLEVCQPGVERIELPRAQHAQHRPLVDGPEGIAVGVGPARADHRGHRAGHGGARA